MRLVPTAVCATLLFAGPSAYAQDDQQDVVVLSSGNRLRGQVIGLNRGELSFSIDGAGAVDIDWNNVETLTSSRVFEVELASGRRLSGSIVSPSPGRIAVASVTAAAVPGSAAAAGVATVIGKQDVVRITPAVSPAEGISGYVDFGADFLSASDKLDLTLYAELEKRTRNYLTSFSLDSIVSEADDGTDHRRNYLQVTSKRFLANRWFAVGRLDLEEDRAFDLDSRALLGAGGPRST
jgi:hypothetical protein